MSTQIRCDGCGGWLQRSAVQGRRSGDLGGENLPPLHFDWCRMCAKIAFDAVFDAGEQRAARRNAGARVSPGRQLRPVDDRTAVMAGLPESPAPLPVVPSRSALLGWLPRRELGEETAILPQRRGHGD